MAEDQQTFLGLDIGTSSVKALLIGADQRVATEATVPLSVFRPHPLWSEQDPAEWVEGVEGAVAALRRHAPREFAALAGVGLSGQMHGATLLDRNDKPLRPAILWNDGRSFAECAELKRRVPDVEKRTGNLVMPGFTAPKMLWVAKHEPEVAKATRRVLLPKDYVRLKLSGQAVSEMSDASGTSWLDVSRRTWDEALLDASGLKLAAMPGLVEGSEVSAHLSPEVAKAWGLEGRAIPIAGGGGDNAASAIGVGATAPGEGFVSLGTSGVVFSVTDRYVTLPERTLHAFCHALPHRWHGMSVMLSAASALSWIAAVLGREADIGQLVAAAEGFARSFADGVEVLDAAGARPERPLLVGGGARSEFWGQMISDATGLMIDLAAGAEAGAALGAARLAMLAAGAGSVGEVCMRPPTQRTFEPRAEREGLHAPRLKRYRALYPAEKTARIA